MRASHGAGGGKRTVTRNARPESSAQLIQGRHFDSLRGGVLKEDAIFWSVSRVKLCRWKFMEFGTGIRILIAATWTLNQKIVGLFDCFHDHYYLVTGMWRLLR